MGQNGKTLPIILIMQLKVLAALPWRDGRGLNVIKPSPLKKGEKNLHNKHEIVYVSTVYILALYLYYNYSYQPGYPHFTWHSGLFITKTCSFSCSFFYYIDWNGDAI